MAKLVKKVWYVKREVVATSLREALRTAGKVYEVQLADEKEWPQNKKKLGFQYDEKKNKD